MNQKEEHLAFPVAIPVFAILIVCYRAYYIAQAIASDRIWQEAGTLLMICLVASWAYYLAVFDCSGTKPLLDS